MRRIFPVIALALALSLFAAGCDGSKSKNEKSDVKKEKKAPPKPTIGGKYETSLDVARVIDTGNIPADVTGDVKAVLDFKKDSTVNLNFSTRAEAAVSQIDNALIVPVDIDGEGAWNYDEKTKKLVITLDKTNIDVGELTLKHDVKFASLIIKQFGGARDQIKSELQRTLFDKGVINVTSIAKDQFEGTWRLNGEDVPLTFKKIN